jgi:hypothetical protein
MMDGEGGRAAQALSWRTKKGRFVLKGSVHKQYNIKVRLEEKKALSAASLPAPRIRLEEEKSELRIFVTVFKYGRENYETKMAAARRDLAVTWV